MRTLVCKMRSYGILRLELIFGSVLMAALAIGIPASLLWGDATLLTNPYILGFLFILFLIFAVVEYFLFVRPYRLYRRLPVVQAECDDKFLYIHGKREAKIPLSKLANARVRVFLPFLLQKEFLREILLHIFSERYGDLVLEIPGYGDFKLSFVPRVEETANELLYFIAGIPENA